MKYLFLDTNIFLHYKGFEDIPWKELLVTDDEITIVLASIILREIDKHKDSAKGKVRDRAKKISKKVNEVLLQNKPCRIPLVYCRESSISEEEQRLFDLSVNDDRFLLNILHCSYNIEDVYVVSNDTDVILKAREVQLNYLYMDETYRASEEPTEEEKKLRILQEKYDQLVNRQSKPIVLFSEENSECLTWPQKHYRDLDSVVEAEIEKDVVRFPVKEYPNRSIPTTEADKIFAYNHMREEYIAALRTQKKLKLTKIVREDSFKPLTLIVCNIGNAQTGDLFVRLRFPLNVKLYTKDESIKSFEYKEPMEPVYNQQTVYLSRYHIPPTTVEPRTFSKEMWDVDSPSAKTDFSTNYFRLTHGLQATWETGIFINTEEPHDFNIEWLIMDSSLIEPQKGVLRVIVSDESQNEVESMND